MLTGMTSNTRGGERIRRSLARTTSVLAAGLLIGVGSLAFAVPAQASPDADFLGGVLDSLTLGADQGATAFAAPALLAATSPVSGVIDGMTFEADADNVAAGATLTDYTPGTLDVTIPSTVTLNTIIYTVTAIGDDAFTTTGLTSLTLPDSVTSIGEAAFAGNALTTLTVPDSVTTIGVSAFSFNSLTTVTIPGSDSGTTIGAGAFALNQIAELHLGSGVTEIEPVAFALNLLTELTIPDSVTTIGQASFAYNHLQTVTVGSSVTTIGDAAFSANYPYVFPNLDPALFTAATATLKNVTFTGAAPTTITDITGDGTPANASFGPFDVLVSYQWAFGSANAVPGGFTSPTWKGYSSQATATVDFELNGHATAIDSQAIVVGQAATEPTEPHASGFTFVGWFTDAALGNAFDFTTPINGDTTLYAKWVQTPATVTVTFNMNGHGTQITAQKNFVGDVALLPAAPTATDHTFTGWYTDADATESYDFDTALTGNITLYAGWTENSVPPVTAVTVSFDLNGHGTPIASQSVTVGDLATKPEAPTATGYAFTGWFTDAAATNAFSFSTEITTATTLYAGWTQTAVVPTPPTATPTASLAATGTADPTLGLLTAVAALVLGGLLIMRRRIRSN